MVLANTTRWHRCVTWLQHCRAFSPGVTGARSVQKVDPPGGTTGRVGFGTGWMRRPCRTQIHEKRFRAKCLPVRVKKTRQPRRSVFERSGLPVRVKKMRQPKRSVFERSGPSGSREENASTKEKHSLEMACLKNSLPKQRPSQPKENQ